MLDPPNSERWRVFQQHESRSHSANDVGHFPPEAGSSAGEDARAFAGSRNILARKPAADDVHAAGELLGWKRPHVIPDWSVVEQAVGDPRLQHSLAVRVVFAVGNGPDRQHELEAELRAAHAAEQADLGK